MHASWDISSWSCCNANKGFDSLRHALDMIASMSYRLSGGTSGGWTCDSTWSHISVAASVRLVKGNIAQPVTAGAYQMDCNGVEEEGRGRCGWQASEAATMDGGTERRGSQWGGRNLRSGSARAVRLTSRFGMSGDSACCRCAKRACQ